MALADEVRRDLEKKMMSGRLRRAEKMVSTSRKAARSWARMCWRGMR